MYDVFISYRRDGGYAMARLLYEHLKSKGLNPFFDIEELRSGPFNTKLYEAIESSSNFLLVLPPNALDRCVDEKDWLRLEIEYAIKRNKNIIPAMMTNFTWPSKMVESISKVSEYNGLELSREYFSASIDKIMSLMKNISIITEQKHEYVSSERNENTYFTSADTKEAKRLKIQQNLMIEFDKETYARVLNCGTNLTVLDVGSNNGDFIMNRMGLKDNVYMVIGLEYDAKCVEIANEKYNDSRGYFYQINVEDDILGEKIESILEERQIEKFDVINLSMIILHLKNPFKLLKTLRKYLRKGGVVVIRDIDDGINYAFPDQDGDFARVVDICQQNETSGYRHSGRQIYTLLKRAGYADIKLEKAGLSTIGMSFEEREALFDTYFSFILDDCHIMVERYPDNKNYLDDYLWMKNIYEELEERFQDETFVFSLGFMLYTACKK